MSHFGCRRVAVEGGVRVAVTGELDMFTAPLLEAALRRAQADAESVVVDLRELQFVDSSGGHVLLAAARRSREAGARFAVVPGRGHVSRFLALTGLDRQLELVDALVPLHPDPRMQATGASAP